MITRIHIRNFKSLVEQEFSLSNLNLLTGINSSGKSSLIQALRMIDKGAALPGHGDFSDLRSKGGSSSGDPAISLEIENDGGQIESVRFSNTQLEIASNHPKRIIEKLIYVSADRLGPQVQLPTTGEDHTISNVGEHGQHCYRFLAEHGSDTVKPPVVNEEKSLRQAVNEWMSVITPDSRLLAEYHKTIDTASLTVNDYRPTNVGFGVSYTLPVIVSLLSSAAESGALVCIENPEAHLHPAAQTKMGELFARCAASGTQVLIETHSDHLLDGIRIAVKRDILPAENTRIYFFTKQNSMTMVESIAVDRKGNIDKWPKGFFDQFMLNGRELLE